MRKLVVSLLLLVIVGFVSSRDVWGGGTPDKVAAFSGAAPAKPPALPAAPEGAVPGLALKFESDGKTVFVSDEYGPFIYQFDRVTGQCLKSFALPSKFAASHLSSTGDEEIAGNDHGRVANKGMEGLATSYK